MKNIWIGLLLCAIGCGQEPEAPRREWDGFVGADLDPADPTLGLSINWVWDESTGKPLYGIAAAATSLTMSFQPNATRSRGNPYVIVRETKTSPPPDDGFLHFIDKSGAWNRTEVRVETLRGWKRISPLKDDPVWRDHLFPLMRKYRLDR